MLGALLWRIMRRDFQIAILLALAAIPAGVALMAAPEYIPVLNEYPGPFFWGGLIIAAGLIGAAIFIAFRGEASEPRSGHRRRMIALTGMIIFGLGFLGSAAWYFWPSNTETPDSTAVARLAKLGWSVQPQNNSIIFGILSKPLPDMKQSAELFKKVGVHFSIQLNSLPNLNGLHYLSGVDNLSILGISAGSFTDISEVGNLRHISELDISQTPIDGRHSVDSSPLGNLANLRKLNLYATKITTLQPLESLKGLKAYAIASGETNIL